MADEDILRAARKLLPHCARMPNVMRTDAGHNKAFLMADALFELLPLTADGPLLSAAVSRCAVLPGYFAPDCSTGCTCKSMRMR